MEVTAKSYRLPESLDSGIAKVTNLTEQRPWSTQSRSGRANGLYSSSQKRRNTKSRPHTTRESRETARKSISENAFLTRRPSGTAVPTRTHRLSSIKTPQILCKQDDSKLTECGDKSRHRESWALTEVNDKPPQQGAPFLVRKQDSEDEDDQSFSDSTGSESDAEEQTDGEQEGNKSGDDSHENQPELKSWMEELIIDSDEYDTDLEDDFPPEPELVPDATGQNFYEDYCKKHDQIPVSYLMRNMGEGHLRMRHHYLGGMGTKPLAEALKGNTICEEIDLSDNYVDGEGAEALADMLKENMFVVNLNVSYNFMRSRGAEAFSEMLETNTTLKTLSLQGNQFTDRDAQRLADALKANMSLGSLDISHNHFGELGGIYLGMGIAANIGLSDIDLSWNAIRQKGAVSIAKALHKNTSLEILDLSWNGFGNVGSAALAQALRVNKSIRVLDISNNRIGTEAAKKLGPALAKNTGLETILMGMNPIGPEGIEAILKGVAANNSLKLLGLEGIPDIAVPPSTQQKMLDLQKSRDIMVMFSTGSPQQSKINKTILAVFGRFVTENADRMEDLFNQMDKDKSGNITLEEFKYGLKDFGLRLTNKQLDMLLDELDADRSGTIEFEELMSGAEMVEQERLKMERAAKEEQIYQESQQHTDNTNMSLPSESKTVRR